MNAPAPVVLASASPRRRRLFGWLGITPALAAADIDEDLSAGGDPSALACALAAEKARAVRPAHPEATVVAFDTIVVLCGEILGKPIDEADARRMLTALSGGTHEVVTGVAILAPGAEEPSTFPVVTEVTMRTLGSADMEAWIAGDECLGCAGAYNIEHHLASVTLDECFNNVAGLPLCHVYRVLADGLGGPVPAGLHPPVATCDATLGRACRLGPGVCAAAER